ncbi:HigA family addiction module antitoxin [Elongatibacter sediminis]|uniref:HigA family addiction module antitoxin n=1 Tax=Elongatibacter sediminis TaxID=3119006 RepID=A0AAW9RCX6_9GAMM
MTAIPSGSCFITQFGTNFAFPRERLLTNEMNPTKKRDRRRPWESESLWAIVNPGISAMLMKVPLHPGRDVCLTCLHPLGLSVTAGAKALGVSRQALNNVVKENAGISPEMLIRLEKLEEPTNRAGQLVPPRAGTRGACKESQRTRN